MHQIIDTSIIITTMEPENDPFAIFEAREDPEISNISQPQKKVRVDIQSALVANIMGDDNKVGMQD